MRTTTKLSLLFLTYFVATGHPPRVTAQETYQAAVSRAEALLKQSQYLECLTAAKEAIKLDDKAYKAYYLAASALFYRDMLSEAETYARDAIARADADNRPDVVQLIEKIEKKKTYLDKVKSADDAFAKGLMSKAAQAYTEAWEAMPDQERIGLKAADLWSSRLKNPGKSAKILKSIQQNPIDPTLAEEVEKKLQALKPAMEQAYSAKLAAGLSLGGQGKLPEAIATLQEAVDTMPDKQEPHLHLARVHALQKDTEGVTRELGETLKLGAVKVDEVFRYPEFWPLFSDEKFTSFLSDAVGVAEAGKARQACQGADAAWTKTGADKNKLDSHMNQVAGAQQKQNNAKDGAEMVWIPAGDFQMGKDAGDLDREIERYGWDKGWRGWMNVETPKHRVRLEGFWMYRYEVTVAMYRKFCEATGRQAPPDPPWGKQPDDHPVVNVSWDDASAYAMWAGSQLPSEEQWEYAACGGEEKVFPWGNEWDRSKCNSASYHAGKDIVSNALWDEWWKTEPLKQIRTTRVGAFPQGASSFGCEDMAGNVWEWCADWFDKCPGANVTCKDFGQTARVVRGGSWTNEPYLVRCSLRNRHTPTYRLDDIGFRCSKTP